MIVATSECRAVVGLDFDGCGHPFHGAALPPKTSVEADHGSALKGVPVSSRMAWSRRALHSSQIIVPPPGQFGRHGRGHGSEDLAPDLARNIDDQPELRPLLVLGEDIALFGRGEAALRAEAQLLERRIFGGLLDPAQNFVASLERSGLRCDEAEHDGLALRQEAQRFEPAGPVAVPFEEIAVDVDAD